MKINELLKPLGTFPEQGSKAEPLPSTEPDTNNEKEDPNGKDKEQPQTDKGSKGKSR